MNRAARPPVGRPEHRAFYFHYAWVIVAIIAAMQMVGTTMRMAFGVLVDPLTETFGWSQGEVTLAYGITSLVTALASPWAGSLGDRYGARICMIAGTAMFVVGMAATALVTEPWHFYVSFGVILGVAQAIFLVPLIPAAMNWFHRRLGLAMGVIMAAWGVGPALAAPVVGLLVNEYGWADSVWIITAVSSVSMFALIALFRDWPSDKGVPPYGESSDVAAERPAKRIDKVQLKLFTGYMRQTKAYWNMSSIHFLGCVGHAIILVYLVPLAMREGMSLVSAAGLLTVLSAVSAITRMTTPMMCERYGAKQVMAFWYVMQGVTVLMLFWAHDAWSFYLFAVIFGIGYGGEAGGFPILNRKYYGLAPVGSAYGVQMLGASMGMALGGWLGGPIFDLTGSYDIVLWLSVVASVAGALSILALESTRALLIPDWNTERVAAAQPDG